MFCASTLQGATRVPTSAVKRETTRDATLLARMRREIRSNTLRRQLSMQRERINALPKLIRPELYKTRLECLEFN